MPTAVVRDRLPTSNSVFPLRSRYLPRNMFPLSFIPTTVCGLCAIAGYFLPSWIETVIPGYHTTYAPLIALIVIYALLRCALRLMSSLVGIAFFAVAAAAVAFTLFPNIAINPTSFVTLPVQRSTYSPIPQPNTPHIARTQTYRSLPSALPDAAYFPNRQSDSILPPQATQFGSGFISRVKEMLRR